MVDEAARRVRAPDPFDLGVATLSSGRLRPPPPLPAGAGDRAALLEGMALFNAAVHAAYETTRAEVAGSARHSGGTAS